MKQLLLSLLFIVPIVAFSQIDSEFRNDEDLIQSILEDVDGEVDLSQLFDHLEYRLRRPINLNRCETEDLLELYILTEQQSYNIISHRDRFGKYISIYELQAVKLLDLESIYRLIPFVTLIESSISRDLSFKEKLTRMDHEVIIRTRGVIEEQNGYTKDQELSGNQYYSGNRFNQFIRYRSRLGKRFSIGFTAEKDAGEEFFKGKRKDGFDFYSGHLAIGERGILKKLIIGDYQVKFGQGLMAWSAFAFGKTPMVNKIKRVPLGVSPYRSVNENSFFRGAAITLEKNNFSLTAYHSRKKRDLNVNDTIFDDDFEALQATFQESGFHRTESELESRKKLQEIITGLNLSYDEGAFHLAINALDQQFEKSISPGDQLYKLPYFSGDKLRALAVDASYRFGNSMVFGEASKSNPGSVAYILGWQIALHKKLDLSLLHRNIPEDYNSFYANPFRELSKAKNEKGFYAGMEFRPSRAWKISAYADHYYFPWLRFQADAPTRGRDYFSELQYKPNKTEEYYLRFRTETKEGNFTGESNLKQILESTRSTLRLNASYYLSKNLRLQSRIELSKFNTFGVEDRGFLAFQNVSYSSFGFPLSLSARLAVFDTDSYNSRIYAYENDVLYFFSVPAYSGNALRYYLNLKFDIGRNLDIWLRYAQTRYADRNVVSGGLSESQGNTRSDFKIQMRYSF